MAFLAYIYLNFQSVLVVAADASIQTSFMLELTIVPILGILVTTTRYTAELCCCRSEVMNVDEA
jgi:hypothetical protein